MNKLTNCSPVDHHLDEVVGYIEQQGVFTGSELDIQDLVVKKTSTLKKFDCQRRTQGQAHDLGVGRQVVSI